MHDDRINQEWVTLNAVRGMVKIASKGNITKSTYDNALELGGVLYPELLGPEHSLLRRERESETTKEFRQLAEAQSIQLKTNISPLSLVLTEIDRYTTLITIAGGDKNKTDQLKRKLAKLESSRQELDIRPHSENQLIFRDAYNIERNIPEFSKGRGHRDFELPDGNFLRLRVLHPDKPEHITGADIIYERHNNATQKVSLIAIQYKIWDKDKHLYLSDPRMQAQIDKIRHLTCLNGLCDTFPDKNEYRFPFCSGFIRPTDRLQNQDQRFISTGEHLPICRIDECKSLSARGAEILEYDRIKGTSLSVDLFENLFNRGKIGSREISYQELENLYEKKSIIDCGDSVVIYAQEF